MIASAFLFNHLFPRSNTAEKRTGQVDVNSFQPLINGCIFGLHHPATPAGVVHQDIE